jgi:hypothetical protein
MGEHLAHYMLPSVMIAIKELPKLPNGKLDRVRMGKPLGDPESPAYGVPQQFISKDEQLDSMDFTRHQVSR